MKLRRKVMGKEIKKHNQVEKGKEIKKYRNIEDKS